MKNFILLGWVSGAVGTILMLLGIIARLAGGVLFNHNWSNYFNSGGMFFALGIFVFLGALVDKKYKEK